MLEFKDINEALFKYQDSFNLYTEIVDSINDISEKVKWASVRFRIRRWGTLIAWIASVVISAIISALFSCELISRFISF